MKPQYLTCDRISTLPSHIIDTILCLLPIHEAARTSILSKEWRYKWTEITKLLFCDYMFEESTDDENEVLVSERTMEGQRKKMDTMHKVFYAIYQVLLMRQGPIHEFILAMEVDKTSFDIDHIISYLLRNNTTLKKLTIHLYEDECANKEEGAYYWLPSSVISFHHLTHLRLSRCDLNRKPTFSGFSRLTSLNLKHVYISTKSLLHLVSNCPLLKRFTLIVEKEDLVNDDNSTTIIELFKCLPMIEHLRTNGNIAEYFVIDSVAQDIPTSLIHLKYFRMDSICFKSPDELRFLALLIRSSPNLEKIKLNINAKLIDQGMVSVIREAYSDIWLEHLKELDIKGSGNLMCELEVVKFIYAKSPKLDRVWLRSKNVICGDERSEIIRFLSRRSPASELIQLIIVCPLLASKHLMNFVEIDNDHRLYKFL